MAYKRKTRDIYCIETNYGYGWESESEYDTYAEAKAFYDQFDENDGWVGLFTTKKKDSGVIDTDKLIMEKNDKE